jgi:hypothetical protein
VELDQLFESIEQANKKFAEKPVMTDDKWAELSKLFPDRNDDDEARSLRIYTLIARYHDKIVMVFDVNSLVAREKRQEFRRRGYRVDLIEQSTIRFPTQEVVVEQSETPVIEMPKDIQMSIPWDIISSAPNAFLDAERLSSRMIAKTVTMSKRFELMESIRLSKANAKRNIQSESIKVYEKCNSELRFSGNLEDAVNFIFSMMNSGMWSASDWVIYVPSVIYNELMK